MYYVLFHIFINIKKHIVVIVRMRENAGRTRPHVMLHIRKYIGNVRNFAVSRLIQNEYLRFQRGCTKFRTIIGCQPLAPFIAVTTKNDFQGYFNEYTSNRSVYFDILCCSRYVVLSTATRRRTQKAKPVQGVRLCN